LARFLHRLIAGRSVKLAPLPVVKNIDRFHLRLRRLKTYLRNSTRQDRLSGIGLLNIEKDFEVNTVQMVTDFVAKKRCEKHAFSKQNLFIDFQLIFNDNFWLFTAFEH
jgi:hypothetical protein